MECRADGSVKHQFEQLTKSACLELLSEIFTTAGEAFKRVGAISYAVRRLVCPVVLLNCTDNKVLRQQIFRPVLGEECGVMLHTYDLPNNSAASLGVSLSFCLACESVLSSFR
jgi:hypothetical protein